MTVYNKEGIQASVVATFDEKHQAEVYVKTQNKIYADLREKNKLLGKVIWTYTEV